MNQVKKERQLNSRNNKMQQGNSGLYVSLLYFRQMAPLVGEYGNLKVYIPKENEIK